MQQPRRTSEFQGEFCDDSGIIKSQIRQPQRQIKAPSPQPSGSGAMKYATRQSRLCPPSLDRQTMLSVPGSVSKVAPSPSGTGGMKYGTRQSRLRPPSLERLTVPGSLSKTMSGRTTPMRTPLSINGKSSMQRVLFTERSGVAPHNDKKWIQEQAQQITDYLYEMVPPGSIPGIGKEFFSNGNCLRQMSIKHFVGIINFFLKFIWRNRFVVGTNHVEDIIQILQKLNYPYQVNKSWLMTPNVQHSFQHVILLLGFLKDFAPPAPTELQQCEDENRLGPLKFPLVDESHTMLQSCSNMSSTSMSSQHLKLDMEFLAQLLQNAEKGFQLWDKQLLDDFNALKQNSCSMLIRKRCDLPDSAALDADLLRLQQELDKLSEQLPPLPDDDEERFAKLIAQQQRVIKKRDYCISELQELIQKPDMLSNKRTTYQKEIYQLNKNVETLQQTVNAQRYSVKQRDSFAEEVKLLTHQLQVHERAVCDLQSRNHNQQVILSRTKKKLTDEIERYNAHMRELHYSGALKELNVASNELELPLQPNAEFIVESRRKLEQIRAKLVNQQRAMHSRRMLMERELNELKSKIQTQLEPTLSRINVSLQADEQRMLEFQVGVKEMHSKWVKEQHQLEEDLQLLSSKCDQLGDELAVKKEKLAHLQRQHEEMMYAAEQQHAAHVSQRQKFLDQYEQTLAEAEDYLQKLETPINNNELHRLNLVKEMEQINFDINKE